MAITAKNNNLSLSTLSLILLRKNISVRFLFNLRGLLGHLDKYERARCRDTIQGKKAATKRVEASRGLNLTQLIAIVIRERQIARLKLNMVTLKDTISRTTGIQSTEKQKLCYLRPRLHHRHQKPSKSLVKKHNYYNIKINLLKSNLLVKYPCI